jgi:hypothetical protein
MRGTVRSAAFTFQPGKSGVLLPVLKTLDQQIQENIAGH